MEKRIGEAERVLIEKTIDSIIDERETAKKRNSSGDHVWNTGLELDWLADLGKEIHTRDRISPVMTPRRALLQNYSQAIVGRRWDANIDVGAITEYLKQEGICC